MKATLACQISSHGVYDGLEAERVPGDLAVTHIDTGSMIMIHEYYSENGELKGAYANISTRPELKLEGVVKYVDLYIDVVKARGRPPKIMDEEELESAVETGVLGNFWAARAKTAAREAASILAEKYP